MELQAPLGQAWRFGDSQFGWLWGEKWLGTVVEGLNYHQAMVGLAKVSATQTL